MAVRGVVLISLALISIVSFIHGFLEIIPQRAGVEYINKKYIQNAKVSIRKTGRGGIYVGNMDFTVNDTYGDNVTVEIISYQFLHNEYRRSFMEVHWKLCYLLEKSPILSIVIRNAGMQCPIVAKEYHLHNLTLQVPEIQDMKWVFPFEKTKFRVITTLTTTNETVAIGYIMLTIRQSHKKPRT